MLPVSVKLDRIAVALFPGVFHPGLKTAGQSQIDRKIQKTVAPFSADLCSPVLRAVIDYDIVKLRKTFCKLIYHPLYIFFLIVCRYYKQHLIHLCHPLFLKSLSSGLNF